ncbi:MAG TPA: monovalent cation/H+ antiporter subunit A [Woeseiaceae bacterium]|nr:monovalent cation/H+ antiporter subunit A [Woeseiaceae bacterium]
MLLALIVLLPFAGSLLAALLPKHARNVAAAFAGTVALACAVLVALHYPQVTEGGVVRHYVPWLPVLGLNLYFRMDGFAWLFAMLVTLIGALVVFYARYYMSREDPVARFFSFLLAFMGAMLGIVLSGNLIQLVVFWELTSLTSFMLIAYWYHLEEARRGARMALVITVGGGLSLLLGVLMLGAMTGSYDIDVVLASADEIRGHRWYAPMLVLVAVGALTKSAQFPFHFWLPRAMAAPTPVSAYLHSAAMVKAGVFLLARLWPALSGTELWFWLICGAGGLTLLIGAFNATYQRDIKGVLAYSTISHLGLITMLLGMNSTLALIAAIFHMMNHATFKASLFMAAGIVQHETGTRDIGRLCGLRRAMPLTTSVALVAAAAMAGVPLLNGFLSKEMFFSEAIAAGDFTGFDFSLPAVATIGSAFSVAYSLRFGHQVFFGPPCGELPRKPHEPLRGMLLPSALLVLACVLVGIFPTWTFGPFLGTAGLSIVGAEMPAYRLAVWHGVTTPLLMSFVALAAGVLFYAWQYRSGRTMDAAPLLSRINPQRLFDLASVRITRGAGHLAEYLFTSRLQPQLLLMVCLALVAGFFTLRDDGWSRGIMALTPVDPLFAMLWVAGGACAIGAAVQAKYHRLAAVIMVGATGLVTCLTFAWFAAPDLALTQLTVEVVTMVLFLLGLRWLPRFREWDDPRRKSLRARARRTRDALIAVAAGAGVSALAFAALTRPVAPGLSSFFVENALSEGGGRNIVNVILVDFRGFDTFGEITVVSTVAIIVYAMLRRFRPAPESILRPTAQAEEDAAREDVIDDDDDLLPTGYLKIPAVLVRLLLPMAGLVSLYFLFRGHNAPGGGFVGGLVMATALIVQYMVGGTIWVESRIRIHPQLWIGAGLLLAAAAGIVAWLAADPFLTSQELTVAGVHLSTVLLFDLGIYLVVVGSAVLMLIALAHQSLRSPRKRVEPVHRRGTLTRAPVAEEAG